MPLRGGDVLYEIQRERPLDTIPLESYAPFVRAGHRHAKLDELLAHLAGLRASACGAGRLALDSRSPA